MAKVAYLCTDLLFTSKIRETAHALGRDLAPARSVDGFVAAAEGAALAILDLRRPDALAALARLRAHPATCAVPAVGFCDHERVELMDEARRADCQTVLAKGKFSSDLRRLLGDTLSPPA